MSAVHITGDAPGSGTYYCMVCGWRIALLTDDQLPPCEDCGKPDTSRYYHY